MESLTHCMEENGFSRNTFRNNKKLFNWNFPFPFSINPATTRWMQDSRLYVCGRDIEDSQILIFTPGHHPPRPQGITILSQLLSRERRGEGNLQATLEKLFPTSWGFRVKAHPHQNQRHPPPTKLSKWIAIEMYVNSSTHFGTNSMSSPEWIPLQFHSPSTNSYGSKLVFGTAQFLRHSGPRLI